MGVSPITHNIYYGTTRKDKKGFETWVRKEDVTEEALRAVFEFMFLKSEETGKCGLSIDDLGTMTFERCDRNKQ